MDRRSFLRWSAASVTAAALSGWLASHAESEDKPTPGRVKPDPLDAKSCSARLKSAYRTARDAGKPMLVLVQPADLGDAYRSGQLLGVAINNASDTFLANLALCEIVATTSSDLAVVIPEAAALGSPTCFLVEAASKPVTVTPVKISLEDLVDPANPSDDEDYKVRMERAADAVKARNARVAQVIGAALAGSDKLIKQRGAANLKAIGKETWARTLGALRSGKSVADADVLKAAPLIRLECLSSPKRKVQLMRTLTAVRTKTLKESPPPGAKWAQSSGCGTKIEGDESDTPGVCCGMGSVPPLSNRFLVYYTKT